MRVENKENIQHKFQDVMFPNRKNKTFHTIVNEFSTQSSYWTKQKRIQDRELTGEKFDEVGTSLEHSI
jgi:hypothetical protein